MLWLLYSKPLYLACVHIKFSLGAAALAILQYLKLFLSLLGSYYASYEFWYGLSEHYRKPWSSKQIYLRIRWKYCSIERVNQVPHKMCLSLIHIQISTDEQLVFVVLQRKYMPLPVETCR